MPSTGTTARLGSTLQELLTHTQVLHTMPTITEIRENVDKSLASIRNDHRRSLNPTPYKVRGFAFVVIMASGFSE